MKKIIQGLGIVLAGILLTTGIVHAATILFPSGGGLGTGIVPTYGQVPVGTGGGIYTPMATSTLGLAGGTNFWTGSLTGNISNLNSGNVGIGSTSVDTTRELGVSGSTLVDYTGDTVAALEITASSLMINPGINLRMPLSVDLSTGKAIAAITPGDSFGRFNIYSDGKFAIGPGYATRDTVILRVATNTVGILSTSLTTGTGNLAIATTTPWAQLSINPNRVSGPELAIGSTTKTDFMVNNDGKVGIGTTSPTQGALNVTGIGYFTGALSSSNLRTDVGTSNTFIGVSAGNPTVSFSAINDVCIGFQTCQSMTTLNGGTVIGINAGMQQSSGFNATYFGANAGRSILTNSNDTFIGPNAGYADGFSTTTAVSNSTAIGNGAQVLCSSCIVLGTVNTNTPNVGIGTTTPNARIAVAGAAGSIMPLAIFSTSTATFATSTVATITSQGLVGIGTTTPGATVAIQSNSTTLPVLTTATTTGKTLSSIDSVGNQYTGGDPVTVASCGSGATVVGNNNSGRVTVGSTALQATCTVTFADGGFTSTVNAPSCIVNMESALNIVPRATPTQTVLVIVPTTGTFTSAVISYQCGGF